LAGERFDTRRNRILLVAASVGISVLVGGLVLWALWPSPPPPEIASQFSFYDQWGRPVSGRAGALKLVLDPATIYANWPAQRTEAFTIDEHGFRITPRRPGRPQIVILGGSTAFGLLVPSDRATFAARLAERMTEYDVLNAAVIGFQSGQELSLMIHRLDNPHVATYVAFNGWNDLFDAVGESTPMRPVPVLGFNNTFLVIQDRLWDFYRSQGEAIAERSRLAPSRVPQMSIDEYAGLVTDIYLRNVDRMYAFARARGARFLLVLQPEVGGKPLPSPDERNILAQWDTLKGYVRRGFPDRYATMRKAAAEFCERQHVPCLDMSSASEFRAERDTLFLDAVHLNERGHRLAADLIARCVRELR
jgi:hypothetical protein